jgi:hypothetical protein
MHAIEIEWKWSENIQEGSIFLYVNGQRNKLMILKWCKKFWISIIVRTHHYMLVLSILNDLDSDIRKEIFINSDYFRYSESFVLGAWPWAWSWPWIFFGLAFHHDHFGICQEYTWGRYDTVRSRSRAKNETFTVCIFISLMRI